jgi:hypothetical protein
VVYKFGLIHVAIRCSHRLNVIYFIFSVLCCGHLEAFTAAENNFEIS